MIRLIKTSKPDILQLQGNAWTNEVMQFYYSGSPIPKLAIDRYRHPQIKSALVVETSDKCAYCESHITDTYPGDIEHILPKSVFPRWAFYWNNLTLACSICNNKKSDYVSKSMPLLNPYKDDITAYLVAIGPIIMHKDSSERGEFAIMKLKLNRPALRERRLDAIRSFQNMLDKYNRAVNQSIKGLYKDELLEMLQSDKEYAFTLQCYAIAQNFLP